MTRCAANLWGAATNGVRLRVRLTPKSSRDQIDGIEQSAEGPALKARVRAVPEDGQANAALSALVADWLDVPKGTVSVVAGQKSRLKTLGVDGDAAKLGPRIDALIALFGDPSSNSNTKRTGA